jgi:hypothetical protein
LPRIQLLESVHRLIDGEQVVDTTLGGSDRVVQRYVRSASASLFGVARLCIVDKDTPHRTSGDGEKVGPILPGDVVQAETKISLVHEGGRTERVPGALAFELTMGYSPQIAVDD